MIEDKSRFQLPRMKYYRHLYASSPLWDGQAKDGRLLVYCEQGYGDIIQMARYFNLTNNQVIAHCPRPLFRLLSQVTAQCIDKQQPVLPEHDYHIPSMSLPFVLSSLDAPVPYLTAEPMDLAISGYKVGIAWEGNVVNARNPFRSCPLRYFQQLTDMHLFVLQKEINDVRLTIGCDDMQLLGVDITDFLDVASLIAALDAVVSVDTAALHLAGALGKTTFGLLGNWCDERWHVQQWYPSVRLMQGRWSAMLARVAESIGQRRNG